MTQVSGFRYIKAIIDIDVFIHAYIYIHIMYM